MVAYPPQIAKQDLSIDGELANVVRREDWVVLWTRVTEMKFE